MAELLWKKRKRIFCGLPFTFTVYSFDSERFYIEQGFLNKRSDEVRLYRMTDLSVTRSFSQRIFGLGTIHINSSDNTLKNFDIVNIPHVMEVKEQLAELIENQRDKKRIYTRESLDQQNDQNDDDDEDDDDDDNTAD